MNANTLTVNGRQHFTLMTDKKAANLICPDGHRTITQNFRNPARHLSVNIPADAWTPLKDLPAQYAGLLDQVLEMAAKSILKSYAESFSIFPQSIPVDLLTADAIMAEAVGANSDWMNKEELTAAWEASATRKKYVTDPRYAGSKDYRIAVNRYTELVLKLAGKTSSYTEIDLDVILAKLEAADLDTPMGSFIVKRVEALKNKKPAETPDMMALL